MQYTLVNKQIKYNYAEELLQERGVKDAQRFLYPTLEDIQDPGNLDNIEQGAEIFLNALNEDSKILVVVDPDCDGFTSFSILYLYSKQLFPDAQIDFILHNGKQHGLEDVCETIKEMDCSLVVLPDSSTNDYFFHEELKNYNKQCLVLDHHLSDSEVYSENACIINNQISNKYKNKELTGAGVVYQFCRYLDQQLGTIYAEDYCDLAALGIIGDMGSMLSQENRYITYYGLSNVHNLFFKTLIDKQSYSMNNLLSPMTVAFYIVPLINAMIRVGTMEEKTRMVWAFIEGEKEVPCNKRGAKGTFEKVCIESARECTNAKNKQNKIKESVTDQLEVKIHKYGLLENEILFVKLEDDIVFPSVLNGLIAMQLAAKFKKPTIVAKLNDEGFVRGSARGLNESALKSFKNYLDETTLFEYNAGHDQAFGTSIRDSDIDKLHRLANTELEPLELSNNWYDVNFVLSDDDQDDLEKIIFELDQYKSTWGQQNPEPVFAIEKVFVDPKNISVLGKNNDTLKIQCGNVSFLKFRAKQMIEDLKQQTNIFTLTIVGKGNVNEWAGRRSAQIFIEDYEIEEYSF